jgi:hypothetical protein
MSQALSYFYLNNQFIDFDSVRYASWLSRLTIVVSGNIISSDFEASGRGFKDLQAHHFLKLTTALKLKNA